MEFMNFILISSSIHGVLFVLFPIISNKKLDKPLWFLNGVVLFISLNNLQAWLIELNYTSNIYFFKHFEMPWYMLIVPLFHLFLIFHLNLENKIYVEYYKKLLFILLLIEVLIRTSLIFMSYFDIIKSNAIQTYTYIEEIFNFIYSIFLFFKSFEILNFKSNFSSHMNDYNSSWLKQFMILGSAVILFWLFAIVTNLIVGFIDSKILYSPLRIASSVLIFWIGYQALFHYNLVENRISLRRALKKNFKTKVSDLSKPNFNKSQKFDDLNNYIITNEKYLDPLFSLNSISEDYGLSVSYISNLVNKHSGFNFSDYINSLRVEYAKQILTNQEYYQYTIIAIGLECGFNSKSTFYSAFKKFTNKTPIEFRRQNIS